MNYPLDEIISGDKYFETLNKAVNKIKKYKPDYLIIALGLDTAKGDPTGTWSLSIKDFERNGSLIASLKIPTLIIQEGGYRNQVLGTNAKAFFRGFYLNHNIFYIFHYYNSYTDILYHHNYFYYCYIHSIFYICCI